MKKWLTRTMIAIVLVYGGAVIAYNLNPTKEVPKQPVAVAQPEVEQPPTVEELLKLVNEERASVGVKPLQLDPLLNKSAQWKSDDMVNRNYFGHWPETMDGKPNTEKYTMNLELRIAVGRICVSSSENITDNLKPEYNRAGQAIANWRMSKPHYTAMVDPRYESTGFGISGTKIAQHFCDQR